MDRAAEGAAVVIALVVLVLIAACPAGVDARACQAHEACVDRVYRAREPAQGVTAHEAALVARLDAERACALAGWSLAEVRSEVVRVTTATAAYCPPCSELVAEPICDARPLLVDVLSHAGACALCGGAVALGAWATAREGP